MVNQYGTPKPLAADEYFLTASQVPWRPAADHLDRALMIVAARAAETVGIYLRQVFRQPLHVYAKHDIHDPVTVHDHYVENRLQFFLGSVVPNARILGEETGENILTQSLVQAAGQVTVNQLLSEGLPKQDGQLAQPISEERTNAVKNNPVSSLTAGDSSAGGESEMGVAGDDPTSEWSELDFLAGFSFDTPDPFGRPQVHFDPEWEAAQHQVAQLGQRVRFIVDPIDGTANFASGSSYFATSIGVELDGEPVAGAVYSPFTWELYCADLKQALFVHNYQVKQLFADGPQVEAQAVLNGYFPLRAPDPERSLRGWQRARRVAQAYATVHSPGSGALDLVSVAAGHAGAAMGTSMKPWDVAAGIHLVRVAGGTVTTFENRHNRQYPEHLRGAFVASAKGLDAVTARGIIVECAQEAPPSPAPIQMPLG